MEKYIRFPSDSQLVLLCLDFEVQGFCLEESWAITKLTQNMEERSQFRLNCICSPKTSHLHLPRSQSLFLGKHFSHMLSLGEKT